MTSQRDSKRLSLFLRSAIPDLILVLVVSLGVEYALLSGFDASVGLRGNIALMSGIGALMLAVLFAGAWSKKAAGASALIAVLLGLCIVGGSVALVPGGIELIKDGSVNDEAGNYLIFALVAVVTPAAAYLLSRRRVGVVVLAFLAVAICAGVQFLFRDWIAAEGGLIAFGAALFGSLALVIYQRFRHMAYTSSRSTSPAFGHAFAFSVGVAALSIGVGLAVFFGLVSGLNLETPVIKPFEMRIMRPIIEYTGIYDVIKTENPDIRTSLVSDEEADTNQQADGGDVVQDEQQDAGTNPLVRFIESLPMFDNESWDESANPLSYEQLQLAALVAVLLLALALVAIVMARRHRRVSRLRKLGDKSPNDRALYLYGYLRSCFAKLGVRGSPSQTPMEYAFARHQDMEAWNQGTGKVSFVRLTLLYQRAAYGGKPLSEAEYGLFERYYRAFYENTRRHVGKLRWLYWFWRI